MSSASVPPFALRCNFFFVALFAFFFLVSNSVYRQFTCFFIRQNFYEEETYSSKGKHPRLLPWKGCNMWINRIIVRCLEPQLGDGDGFWFFNNTWISPATCPAYVFLVTWAPSPLIESGTTKEVCTFCFYTKWEDSLFNLYMLDYSCYVCIFHFSLDIVFAYTSSPLQYPSTPLWWDPPGLLF